MDKPIRLTEKAIAEIKREAEIHGVSLNEIYLRIGIATVTCCGFSYLLEFTKEKTAYDFELEIDCIRILIDRSFCTHLEDTEIDYVVDDDLQKTGFVFKNPSERSTCGCGKSHPPDGKT